MKSHNSFFKSHGFVVVFAMSCEPLLPTPVPSPRRIPIVFSPREAMGHHLGKLTVRYGKSPFIIGKSTINDNFP
jgi:hypothetical protein